MPDPCVIVLFPSTGNPDALAHAAAGGQSLEVWPKCYTYGPKAPRCFRGKDFCKLYDQDALRLTATARRLGVNVIKIDRPGQPGQHLDLVGGPMARALAEAVPAPEGEQP
jgi:hypothetical protein